MRWWKVLGMAGLVGVAATGAVVARDERRRRSYTPDEIRSRLHERAGAPPAPAAPRRAASRPGQPPPRLGGDSSAVPGARVAVQPIRLFGDPVLREKARPVVDFDRELRRLVQDLTDTMLDAPGVGLAAIQLGVPLRVFTYHVDDVVGHLVNPDLTLSDEQQDGLEGCLSLPGLEFDCLRALRVVARGFDQYGEPVVLEGSDLLARCIQHETDHLDGIIFVDRLDREARKKAMKAIREADWSGLTRPRVMVSPHPTFGRAF